MGCVGQGAIGVYEELKEEDLFSFLVIGPVAAMKFLGQKNN